MDTIIVGNIVRVRATDDIGVVLKIVDGTDPITMRDLGAWCTVDFGQYTKTYYDWELTKIRG